MLRTKDLRGKGWLLMGYGIDGRKIVESDDFQRYKIGISTHNYKLQQNIK
ncbi:MAG: hypothetical protein M3N30_11715 [Bacteroidota bacterium]|nr:hypothetical protein [Bacteroidota bacterium]